MMFRILSSLVFLFIFLSQPPNARSEVLRNGNFRAGIHSWQIDLHGGAEATGEILEDEGLESGRFLRIHVTTAGTDPWSVQLLQRPIAVKAGTRYYLTLHARADNGVKAFAVITQAHGDYTVISEGQPIQFGPTWKEFSVVLDVESTEEKAQLLITNLNELDTTIDVADVKLEEIKPETAPK